MFKALVGYWVLSSFAMAYVMYKLDGELSLGSAIFSALVGWGLLPLFLITISDDVIILRKKGS